MKRITKFIYFGFASIALACFTLSPPLKAQCPSACGSGGNTAVGFNALDSVTTGINNTALGTGALTDDTTGAYNVAVGNAALGNNTTGQQNMAVGAEALLNNISGNFNMGIGFRALFMNTGSRNSAIGAAALRNNTTASDNTAIGSTAMRENTIGEQNTAIGSGALTANTTGGANVAVGESALAANTIGAVNTAVGSLALNSNTSGTENTAVGRRALQFLNGGHENTAIGWGAGANYTGTEFNNICIGDQTSGIAGESNAIRIGTHSTSGGINVINNGPAANSITIGTGNASGGITVLETLLGSTISIGSALTAPNAQTFVGGIFNAVPPVGSHLVTVAANGKLADFTASSRRFKKDIAPIDKISEGILALKPVTFHFKNDDTNYPQFGLIAEDVAEVNPDWITRDPQGEIYGVRYETIPVLLLNEFLKEHRKVEKLEALIAQQRKDFETTLTDLKRQIQKVSAQVELSKLAPQTVAENQ